MWPSFHLFPLTILEKSHQEIFRHWQHNHLSWNRQAGWLALYPQQQELELLLCYCGEGGVLPLLRFKASRPLMGLLASEQPQEVAQIQIDESSPQLSRDWGLDLALLLDLSPASCTPSNCPQSCTLPAPDSGMPLFLLLFPSPFRSLLAELCHHWGIFTNSMEAGFTPMWKPNLLPRRHKHTLWLSWTCTRNPAHL